MYQENLTPKIKSSVLASKLCLATASPPAERLQHLHSLKTQDWQQSSLSELWLGYQCDHAVLTFLFFPTSFSLSG